MGTYRRDTYASCAPRSATALALFATAVVALLALVTPGSNGQTIDELNARIESARGEAEAFAAEIEATTAQLAATQERAIAAAQREAQLSEVLAKGQEREARLEASVRAA